MEEKRICPSCGAESEPGSNFCAACGKPLPKADEPEPEKNQPVQERQGEDDADRQAKTADQEQVAGAAEAETTTPEAAKTRGEEAAPPIEKSSLESAPRTDDALNNVRLAGLAGGALLFTGYNPPGYHSVGIRSSLLLTYMEAMVLARRLWVSL